MNHFALVVAAFSGGGAVLLLAWTLTRALQQGAKSGTLRQRSSHLLDRLAMRLEPRLPERFRAKTEKRLTMAGGLRGLTPERVAAASALLAALGFMLGVLFSFATHNLFWPIVFAAVGVSLPSIWLKDSVAKRHHIMLRQLPFHLDLLTLAVESGMDFTAALAKMVERGKPGPLKEEFGYTLSQIRVGVARAQALKDTAARVDLPQLTTFLSALVQADKLGMSIGKVLRVQSETVREERSQRAEKRANEAPVRILIPLVVFIFPTLWLILFAPLVFSFAF